MPQVRRRYRLADETAVVGESLAGLFVVETFFLEPELFDTYLAFSPSLWWNDEHLVRQAGERLEDRRELRGSLYLSSANAENIAPAAARMAARRRGTIEPVSQLRSPTRLIEALEELGVIDARQAAVFHELRSLRNSAAHALGFEPSPDAARDYVRLAARLEESLDDRGTAA